MNEAKTLGELKKSGVPVLSVRDEMRKNLVRHLESGELCYQADRQLGERNVAGTHVK